MKLFLHQNAGTVITELTSEIIDADIGNIRVSLEDGGWPHLRASLSLSYYGANITPEARKIIRMPGILEVQSDAGITQIMLYWNPANLSYDPQERKYTMQFTSLFDGLAKYVDADNWWNILDAATMYDTMSKFVALYTTIPVAYYPDSMSPIQLDPAYIDETAHTYHPLFAGFIEPTSWLVGQEFEKGEGISWQKFRVLSVLSVAASRHDGGIYALCVGEITDTLGVLSDDAGYYLPFVVYAKFSETTYKFNIVDCYYTKTGWRTDSMHLAAVWFGHRQARTGQRGDSYLLYTAKDTADPQKEYVVVVFVGASRYGIRKGAGQLHEMFPAYSGLYMTLLYGDGTAIHHIDVHREPIIVIPQDGRGGYPWSITYAFPSHIYLRGQGYWTGSNAVNQGVVVWGWTARPLYNGAYCRGTDNHTIIKYIRWTPTGWDASPTVMFELITQSHLNAYSINAGVNYATGDEGAYDPILVMLEMFQDPLREGDKEMFEVQFAFTAQSNTIQVSNEDYSNIFTFHAQGWYFSMGATSPTYDARKRYIPSYPEIRAVCPIGVITAGPSLPYYDSGVHPLVGYAFIYGLVSQDVSFQWAWIEARRTSLSQTADPGEWMDEPLIVDPSGDDPDRCTAYISSLDVDADQDMLARVGPGESAEFYEQVGRASRKDSRAGRYRVSCSQMNYHVYAVKDEIYRHIFHLEITTLSGHYQIFSLALEVVVKPLAWPTVMLYSLVGSDYPMNGNVVPMVLEGQANAPETWRFVCLPQVARKYGMIDDLNEPYWGDTRQPGIKLTEYGAFYYEITTAYTSEPHNVKAGFIISTLPHVSQIGDMDEVYSDIGRVGEDTARILGTASEYRYPANVYNSHRGCVISPAAWWSFANERPNYLESGLVGCAENSYDENLHRLSYFATKITAGGGASKLHIALILTPRWPIPGDTATISGGPYWTFVLPPGWDDDVRYDELAMEPMGIYWDALLLGPEGGAMLTNWWWADQPSFDRDLVVAVKSLAPQWSGVGYYRGTSYTNEMAWLTEHEKDIAGTRIGFRQLTLAWMNTGGAYAVGAVIDHDIMAEIYAACGDPELRQYLDEEGNPREHYWHVISIEHSHTGNYMIITVQEMPGPGYAGPMQAHQHVPLVGESI